jgi:hypothetical protein
VRPKHTLLSFETAIHIGRGVLALCSASPRPTSAGRAGAPSRLEEITTVMASQTLGPYPRLAPSS